MVRLPLELKLRLDALTADINAKREAGMGYQDLEITEQGIRGSWVPMHEVIRKALDELEGHRERSRKSNRKG
jgi:hypothetical protein